MIPYRYMEKLARGLGVHNQDETVLTGADGMVEHLVHEVAHAISLGWKPFRGMETAVGLTLRLDHKDHGETEEAIVLSAEETILRGLGIKGYGPRDASIAADAQNVPRGLMAAAWRSEPARKLGLKVLRYLGRRSGCYRSGARKDMSNAPA